MVEIKLRKQTGVPRTYRVSRALAVFNVEPSEAEVFEMVVDVPLDEPDWRIGMVVGPSGTGKTTIGEALAQEQGFQWWHNRRWPDCAILDAIAPDGAFEDVTATLASVGLGTIQSWLRPYDVLSNGERFRAELARLVVEGVGGRYVIDEFSSVLDRRVACIGSGAFAKAWRRQPSGQVVFLTPHADIVDWVQPCWLVDTSRGRVLLPKEEPKDFPIIGQVST